MEQSDYEDKLMELEQEAQKAGLSIDQIISAYELRSMALQDEMECDE